MLKSDKMVYEQTLIRKGFRHHPEWDWCSIGIDHYRLDLPGATIRAYITRLNGPVTCMAGTVENDKGDCSYKLISSEEKLILFIHQQTQQHANHA